ncbi:hypothetical protein [Amycolatopsis sp. NPDC051128]|uniref:hypothetical protein n=1 Tax=Amycolatopsis sp. NPDC051128 TaxID=3155412 RepID=UPI003441629A
MTVPDHFGGEPAGTLPSAAESGAGAVTTAEELGDSVPAGTESGDRPGPVLIGRTGAHGSVTQAGRDIVNNFGEVLRDRGLRRPLEIARDCFAPIDDREWQRVTAVWRRSRLLVITGPEHVGKRTVALRLLSGAELGTAPADAAGWPIRELVADWEKPAAGMLPAPREQVFLLDLGETEADQVPVGFGEDLRSYVDERPGLRLVVTMTDRAWRRCGAQLSDFDAEVSAPKPRDVVLAHLRYRGFDTRAQWVDKLAGSEVLTSGTLPRDAVRLAAAIEHAPAQARDAQEEGADEPVPVAWILDEFRAWRGHLRDFFSGSNRDVVDRALLIAAAVLDGAPPLVVWRAAMELLDGRAVPAQTGELLAGDDLDTQLARISGAGNFGEGVSLDQVRHGLSAAVLPHVWRQRPQMQTALISWIRTLTRVGGTGRARLATIGRRLAELTSVDPEFDPVDTVRSWLDSTPETRELVADLLTGLAEQDSRLGTSVRNKTRAWAYSYGRRESASSSQLAEMVAQMCAGRFGQNNPNACLIRLKWLLAGPASDIIDELAVDALRRLAVTADDAVRLLAAVLQWESDSTLAAGRGFLALMDPASPAASFEALLRQAALDDEASARLRHGWETTTKQPELGERAARVLRSWGSVALSNSDIAEPAEALLAWVLRRNLRSPLFLDVLGPESRSGDHAPDERSALLTKIVRRIVE